MSSIKKLLITGVLYTALSKYSGIFVSILIGTILARLLTPEEFGIVALVTVFSTFFNLLTDFGIGPAIIQSHNLNEKDIQSIFTFSILLGIVFACSFFFAAPIISHFYNKPVLIGITRLLSLAILFYSLQIVPQALFQKALLFKQLGLITFIVQFISGAIAVLLAYLGFSYYALVVQSILSGGLLLIILYILKPIKITFCIRQKAIRKIIRFSSFQFMFNFINYFSRNTDNILIGKFMGSSQLGYYDKSYRLMLLPVANLTHVITPALMPVLSKFQNDKQIIYSTYLKVIKVLAIIGFPLSIFLYFSANEIINILYGSQWVQSIPIFKILALTVGIQMVLSSTGSIFQALNRPDLLFYSGILSAFFVIGGICYGIFIGKSLEYIGYGLTIAFIINFIQVFYILIRIALKFSYLQFLKCFFFPIVISACTGIVLFMISLLSIEQILISLCLKLIGTLLTFGILLFFKKDYKEKILSIISQ